MNTRRLLAAFTLTLVAVITVPAQTPEVPAPTRPETSRYNNLGNCMKRVAALKGKPCELIFIGDSITEAWETNGREVWDKNYEPLHALNFGIRGDTTQDVAWRLDNLDLSTFHPKVAVILIGTNNTKDTPADIAAGVKAVVTKTQERFPGVKIVLLGILPNKRATEKMAEASALTRPLADGKTVFFLDLAARMTPIETTQPDGKTDTNWKGLLPDHLHLTPEGYQLWAETLAPILQQLL